MLNGDASAERTRLCKLLSERGVMVVDEVVERLTDEELPGALATIAYFDEQPEEKQTAGLLVYTLRQGGFANYKRPHERERVGQTSQSPTPELLRSMRGVLNTPNGITREEAKPTYEAKAKRLGMTVDALIDLAMGSDWTETPVHPALDPDNPDKAAEYARWLG